MKDASSDIVHMVATILEACQSALDKVGQALKESDEQPEIARELLLILNTADDLLEMLDPSTEAAEYHGLPREATAKGDAPRLDLKNEAGWDFMPWYCEKTLSIKNGVKTSIRYWSKNPAAIKLPEGSDITPREWLHQGVLSGLRWAQRDARKIFDMTFEDRIAVSEQPLPDA